MNATAHADYDALPLSQTAMMLLLAGTLGVFIYMLVLLSYFLVPNLKAQHPAANLIIWHVGCGFMTSLGLVVAYGVQVRAVQLHRITYRTVADWLRLCCIR